MAKHNLQALHTTLHAFEPWIHDRMEITRLCSGPLLLLVMAHTSDQDLVRTIVRLLCRIAFHHSASSANAHEDLVELRSLESFLTFAKAGDTELIDTLTSAFAFASWSIPLQDRVLRAILFDIPFTGLSSSSESDIIIAIGKAPWSLVEGFDCGSLANLVGRLPADTILKRMVDDAFVCERWMRLLLFTTFHPPPETDIRPLWKIILSIQTRVPYAFSRDLPRYLNTSEAPPTDFNWDNDSGIRGGDEESLWMVLFWSSRFFEIDCRSWSEFRGATSRYKEQNPRFLQQLAELCFAMDEVWVGPTGKAYTEMYKLLYGTHPTQSARGPAVPAQYRNMGASNTRLSDSPGSYPSPPATLTGPVPSPPRQAPLPRPPS